MVITRIFRKPKEDLGSPLYNLRINVLVNPVTFSVTDPGNDLDLDFLGGLGEVANFAMSHIRGHHLVTDLGFLLPIYRFDRYADVGKLLRDLLRLDATFTINDYVTQEGRHITAPNMHRLIGAVKEKNDYRETETEVKLRYPFMEQNLYVKNGRLLVPIKEQNPLRGLEAAVADSQK